jgi:hypothetical protein
MTSRSRAAAVALVLAAASLAACSSAGEPDPGPDTVPTTSLSTAPYLPVPDGVELTPQGKHLEVGDSAVVAWEPRQGLVGVLDLTVTKIERTTVEKTLSQWQLSPAQRASTPYFVHVDVRNVGETDLGGRAVPLYGLTSGDLLLEATPFVSAFKPCPSTPLPKPFGPEATAQMCLVYLVARPQTLKGVSFRPVETFDPIYWTGAAEPYVAPKPTKPSPKRPKKPARSG